MVGEHSPTIRQLAHLAHDHLSAVRTGPMFEKVNSLPRSEPQAALNDRNGQAYGHHGRLDMRGHVVRTLVSMPQIRHARIV